MTIAKVQAVFRDAFEKPDLTISPEMTAKDVENWDSFNHINLIVALESEFGVTFTTDEIAAMANVGDLIKILNKHGCDVSW